jgi:glycerophosphoryl diester phosphodiesterase
MQIVPRQLLTPKSSQVISHESLPICVAHRGARAYAPENTLRSISKAADLGCKMVEIDVHMSKDSNLVVCHDDDFSRCTNIVDVFPDRKKHPISNFTLNEIKQLDAGSWFYKEIKMPSLQRQSYLTSLTQLEIETYVFDRMDAISSIEIPTLDEALNLAQSLDIALNIEIKSIPRMYVDIARKVVEQVECIGMNNNVLISSFDHLQLVEVRRLSKAICTAALSRDRLVHVENYLESFDCDGFNPGAIGDCDTIGFGSVDGNLDLSEVNRLMSAKKMCFIWTCNDNAQIKKLVDAGVTGVITDYPNRFQRIG